MDRQPVAVGVVVVLVVLSGCAAAPGGGAVTETDTADGTVPDATTTTLNGTLEVHFINVGQSVSTLLVGPNGETMLIDSGDFRDDGEHVLGYLERHNVTRIDHFVVSHADADHIGGNAAVIEYYETEADGIGAIYDPGIAASTQTYEEYLDAVEAHNVTLYETRAGDPLPFGGSSVDVDVLGPPEPYLDGRDRNENSIVLHVSAGASSFLFTGDAEADAERYLVETYNESLRATVLKAGHHGSRSSTGAALLDAVDPRAVVISSANDSQYGHPHEEVLQRLSNRTIPTFWTATHGDIVLTSDGERVTVATQQPAPTRPLSLRSCSAVEPGTVWPVVTRAIFDLSVPAPTETPVATDGGTATASPTASPTPTATATPTSTPVDNGTIVLDSVHADAEGADGDNLNDEYIVLRNAENRSLDMGGWTVADAADHVYTVPAGFTLGPNETVTLHTGSGTDTDTDLYWGAGRPIWNNGGDTVIVTTDAGEEVLREEYS